MNNRNSSLISKISQVSLRTGAISIVGIHALSHLFPLYIYFSKENSQIPNNLPNFAPHLPQPIYHHTHTHSHGPFTFLDDPIVGGIMAVTLLGYMVYEGFEHYKMKKICKENENLKAKILKLEDKINKN